MARSRRDPLAGRGFIKNFFDGGYEGEVALDLLNDLVDCLPDACRDPEEVLILQEEARTRVQEWPLLTYQEWHHPEQVCSQTAAAPPLRQLVLANLQCLTKKQRRQAWEGYTEAMSQCGRI